MNLGIATSAFSDNGKPREASNLPSRTVRRSSCAANESARLLPCYAVDVPTGKIKWKFFCWTSFVKSSARAWEPLRASDAALHKLALACARWGSHQTNRGVFGRGPFHPVPWYSM